MKCHPHRVPQRTRIGPDSPLRPYTLAHSDARRHRGIWSVDRAPTRVCDCSSIRAGHAGSEFTADRAVNAQSATGHPPNACGGIRSIGKGGRKGSS